MITAAEAMVKCLEKESVKVVFGLPGAAICPFYDALSKSDIKHILVRQEQNAAHAASGYARMTGKPAVCIATSGPGALNLITGIATAYMDSIPMVVITGQVSSELLGRDVFQEADITGSCEPFVKHSYLLKDAAQLPEVFKKAFEIAGTGRKGPVLIDIPIDVQQTKIAFEYPEQANIRSYKPNTEGHPGQITRLLGALKKAKRPIICAGGGVFSSCAEKEVCELSQRLNIPVVTTMMGIGCIPSDYPAALGMIGMHGRENANRAMNMADLIILAGARVGDRAVMSPMGISSGTVMVHIDVDPAEIGKNVAIDIPIVGDVKNVFKAILSKSKLAPFESWYKGLEKANGEYADIGGFVNPHRVIDTLCRKLGNSAVLVADVGQNQIWSARGYSIKNGRFLTTGGMGTMGYSIPAAYGAKLADGKRQVVVVCGDGSFQMQMMELATIAANNIDIKIIVMNNSYLGMVRELQEKGYGGRETGVSLAGNPHFTKLAEAYSIEAEAVSSNADIEAAIEKMLAAKGPYLLECSISRDEPTLEGDK